MHEKNYLFRLIFCFAVYHVQAQIEWDVGKFMPFEIKQGMKRKGYTLFSGATIPNDVLDGPITLFVMNATADELRPTQLCTTSKLPLRPAYTFRCLT